VLNIDEILLSESSSERVNQKDSLVPPSIDDLLKRRNASSQFFMLVTDSRGSIAKSGNFFF